MPEPVEVDVRLSAGGLQLPGSSMASFVSEGLVTGRPEAATVILTPAEAHDDPCCRLTAAGADWR